MAALERARLRAVCTRADLAEALGVDLFTIALYENGESIPAAHAETLGAILGVAPEFVQRGDEIVREALERGYA
jgi:transcriptional regulator with XRE-family HTH domain